MTEETAKLLHEAYNEALRRSTNVLEIVNNLYKIVDEEAEFPEDDLNVIDAFLDGLRGSSNVRRRTFDITNFVTYVTVTFMYIFLWMNSTREKKIDISIDARRKGLESELTKLLKKSDSGDISSYIVRDRFGLRAIIWNDDSEEENIKVIGDIFENIIGIICAKNRKSRKEFLTWIEESSRISIIDKTIVSYILGIPFGVESVKDYISSPKQNGYQTLQFTLTVQMYSELLPGTQLEVQFRTEKMHEVAERGNASHESYKENGIGKLAEIFTVDDFTQINIPGFTGYNKEQNQDVDGIHYAKVIFARRLSETLVPEN